MKALCFGSLNIDYTYRVGHFVQKGETVSSDELNVYIGGKGLNQSVALAKAGAEVYHAGAVGVDGKFLLEFMEKAGVHTEYISILEDTRTGNAIIQNDKAGDNCILLYGGANQAITKEQIDSVFSHFESGDYLILQNEINNLSYIMEKAHEKSMVIVLNPSPMNKKIRELPLECVNLFILNEVEIGQLLEFEIKDRRLSENEKENLADKLIEIYPDASVVLTLGGNGSIFVGKGMRHRQKIYQVAVADTTAAGDTFTGYFIGDILQGKTIAEAMDDASAAAAIVCSRSGAAPSIPTVQELEEFKKKQA